MYPSQRDLAKVLEADKATIHFLQSIKENLWILKDMRINLFMKINFANEKTTSKLQNGEVQQFNNVFPCACHMVYLDDLVMY